MTEHTIMNETSDSIFDGGDFVFMERTNEDGKKEIIGGGYKINSLFLQDGIPALTTFNTQDQNGGKVSSPFENLAVPAGLFYINQPITKNPTNKEEQYYKNHEPISDDIMDKLFGLVEYDKKQKRKTRKHRSSSETVPISVSLTNGKKSKKTRKNNT